MKTIVEQCVFIAGNQKLLHGIIKIAVCRLRGNYAWKGFAPEFYTRTFSRHFLKTDMSMNL